MIRVEPLRFEDFDGLDIVPTTKLGVFRRKRIKDLLSFCEQNPEYHIISHLGPCIEMNKLHENATYYELGKGENDPELTYIALMDWKSYKGLKILEFHINKP